MLLNIYNIYLQSNILNIEKDFEKLQFNYQKLINENKEEAKAILDLQIRNENYERNISDKNEQINRNNQSFERAVNELKEQLNRNNFEYKALNDKMAIYKVQVIELSKENEKLKVYKWLN